MTMRRGGSLEELARYFKFPGTTLQGYVYNTARPCILLVLVLVAARPRRPCACRPPCRRLRTRTQSCVALCTSDGM